VSHKVAALERVVARFSAYSAHLTAMTEDSSMQPADRQKMKGYVMKWQISQISLGCASFRDILRGPYLNCVKLCRGRKLVWLGLWSVEEFLR